MIPTLGLSAVITELGCAHVRAQPSDAGQHLFLATVDPEVSRVVLLLAHRCTPSQAVCRWNRVPKPQVSRVGSPLSQAYGVPTYT